MTFRISPGVYPKEVDLTVRASPFATSIGAIVFASKRGSLLPQFISSTVGFVGQYGTPDPTVSFGHDAALSFLNQSSMMWALRVVGNGAAWAALSVVNNELYDETFEGSAYHTIEGIDVDYDSDDRTMSDLIFAGDLVASNQFALTINGTPISPVTYSTSNNNTLNLIAQSIQNVLDGLGDGGSAKVVKRLDSTTDLTARRIIRIVSPTDVTLTFTSLTITGGSSQTSARTKDTDWLFTIYAENPGEWANTMAIGADSVDTGIAQKIELTFSDALVTSNVFDGYLNDVQIGPVNFTTNNDTTLEAIATAIENALEDCTAEVVQVSGSNNNREIIVTAPDAETQMVFRNFSVTSGASQALVSQREVLAATAPTYSFNLKVYNGSLSQPIERWKVNLLNTVDGFGRQLQMAYQVNQGPLSSINIRAVVNPQAGTGSLVLLNDLAPNKNPATGYLTGGEDGNAVSSQQIVAGWNQFSDPEDVAVRILINGGYSTPEVQQNMARIAEARRDCFAILDMPSDMQTAQNAVDYRKNTLNVDSSYAAIYTPDVMIYDVYSGQKRYVPPSGLVAAQYAYTDAVSHEWFAPAGLNRGQIKQAMALAETYNEGDRDYLSLAQVNTIRKMGAAFPIWGEYTLQIATSDLSSVPVRRLLITIETSMVDAVATALFEPNDPITRRMVTQIAEDFLLPIKNARGLYWYKVVCDETNNPPNIIDVRELHLDLYLKPTLAILYIQVQSIITKTGADVTEFVQNGGNF